MDERTKELIAIGASVSGHCQPCLAYHLGKARELGIGEEEIREAVELAYMVEKGASIAMKKYVDSLLNQVSSQDGACCAGGNSKCCG